MENTLSKRTAVLLSIFITMSVTSSIGLLPAALQRTAAFSEERLKERVSASDAQNCKLDIVGACKVLSCDGRRIHKSCRGERFIKGGVR